MLGTDWFIWLIVFCGVTLAGVVVGRWQMRRQGGEGAGCGYCGYPVMGLPTPICPECGNDITEVGTQQPSFWNRLLPSTRRKIALLVWTVWMAGAVLLAIAPFYEYVCPVIRFHCESVGLDVNGHECVVQIDRVWKGHGWEWQTRSTFVWAIEGWRIHIHPPDYVWQGSCSPNISDYFVADSFPAKDGYDEFLVHRTEGWYAFTAPDTGKFSRHHGMHAEELRRWLDAWERRFKRPGLRQDTERAVQAALSAPRDQIKEAKYTGFKAIMSGLHTGSMADRRVRAAGVGVAIFVWGVGCVVLWRRMGGRGGAPASERRRADEPGGV